MWQSAGRCRRPRSERRASARPQTVLAVSDMTQGQSLRHVRLNVAMAEERVLTLRELNRALLERQLLLQRRRLSVQQAVERLCALQAQYSPSPYIALWSRLEGFKKEQLTRALEQKHVVRSSLFRITLHITSARDYPYFAAVWLGAAQARTPGLDEHKVAEASR